MNILKLITTREQGFKHFMGSDISLLRLKCYQEDVFEGVAGNVTGADINPRPPVLACSFSSAPGYEQVIAFANEDGRVALQDTDAKPDNQGPLEGTQTHKNAVFDMAWMPKELKLITASGDRTASLWDVSQSPDFTEIQSFQGHTHTIKSAVFRHEDKAVFATGARDGAIMIWDIRASHSGLPKPDNMIFNAHKVRISSKNSKHSSTKKSEGYSVTHSVTSLVFQDDYNLLSCSAGDGFIKVWDMRKNYTVHKKKSVAKHVLKYGGKSSTYNGFTSLLIDPFRISLYASCVDGRIYSYNLSSYNPNPVAEYYGHLESGKVLSFFVKACLSPNGEFLTSGSNDETAYIWRTRNPGLPFIKLCGHRDDVTSTAWCSVGDTKIVTCSEDCYHRIWRVRPDVDDTDQHTIFGSAERYQITTPRVASSPLKSAAIGTHSIVSTPDSIASTIRSLIHTPQSCTSSLYSDASSSGKPTLSPITESNEVSPRRSAGAARKLHFSPSSNQVRKEEQQLRSPVKIHSASVTTISSPTTGLPNFVIDGTAPHLSNSPLKSKENLDWLTKIRKRKRAEADKDTPETQLKKTPRTVTAKTPTSKMSLAKTPSSRGKSSKRPASDQKKTPKSQRCLMPAITNFCTNLEREM
ncbi:protein lethal(2)denticleless [Copidosoma floridanum]|uniref:protein lethal(2)denticleless n=1 Tax=Copidosoma floridanum TaxID=29053 RepID=UPI0006C9A7E1|nr:protein lethal(2)denticleless [Copidosoma floridanum]